MGLPEIIATVDIAERGRGEDRPYERFRHLVLEGQDTYDRYTRTSGRYYDRHGAFVLEKTGHLEHIHHHDRERQKTGRILGSIRMEERFGERHYILEIYDREFAGRISDQWGNVRYAPGRRREKGTGRYASR